MSTRVYSEINLHITWHTKNNLPMITEKLEPALYQYVKDRVIATPGTYFHAVGGTHDHLHLAVSVKPSVHLDEWIGQLKGGSSHEMGKLFQWQAGYGIVSFGMKDLPWIVNYVLNQKERHRTRKVSERLERIIDDSLY